MSYQVRERLATAENTTFAVVAVVAFLVVAPFILGGFQTSLLAETLIFVLFATAYNLLYGYTGLLSFGHAMFIAAAGYTTAKIFTFLGPTLGLASFGGVQPVATWLLAIVLGVVIATLLSVVIGYFSVQLDEIYFALITLAFSMAIYVVMLQDTIGEALEAFGYGEGSWSNGSDGLSFRPGQMDLFGMDFRFVSLVDPFAYYFFVLVVVALGMYALWRIVQSPFGMICRAIRENPERARALGVNVTYHQWITFIISGAFSGLAGVLLVTLEGNVNPEQHAYWTASAVPVLMTIIGGPYSFLGPAIGSFSFEYIRWFISQYPALEEHWQFSFGVLLLVVILFFENGVAGGINRIRAWLDVAGTRYREDGSEGVTAYASETVSKYADQFREWVGGIGR
jgi:branched-chain amino acid transport system permease protein